MLSISIFPVNGGILTSTSLLLFQSKLIVTCRVAFLWCALYSTMLSLITSSLSTAHRSNTVLQGFSITCRFGIRSSPFFSYHLTNFLTENSSLAVDNLCRSLVNRTAFVCTDNVRL